MVRLASLQRVVPPRFPALPDVRARPVFVVNTALCDRWMCAKPVC
jgi:hypothetical protein